MTILSELEDAQLYTTFPNNIISVIYNRMVRENTAARAYMTAQYPVAPMEPLANLQKLKTRLEQAVTEGKIVGSALDEVNAKILANEGFADGDTVAQQAWDNYIAHMQTFAWPDAAEQTVRTQEESDLRALL